MSGGVTSPSMISISVTPFNPFIAKGTSVQLTATGIYSDNTTQDLTTLVVWNSSSTATATISNVPGSQGLATSLSVGPTTITATGRGVSGSVILTVTSALLTSISVTPPNPSIAKGTSQQFTATGTYSDGSSQNISGSVTWMSGTPTVAMVNGSGLATAVTVGTSLITATSGSISGSTTLTVTSAVLQSIAVTPANPSITPGTSQQFTVTGTYSDGSSQNISGSVTWMSGTSTVATVNGSGLATAVAVGTSLITATSGSISGSTKLTVASNLWTWVSGSSIVNQKGVYGTQGTAAGGNIPGARFGAVSWIDGSGNRWLFGGNGYDSAGTFGSCLNDLWKFDGTNWTWVSGSSTRDQRGVYGTQGTAAAGNIPGARYLAVSWIDGSGNLWLFGGNGYDSAGAIFLLNDLWKFDGSNWTWVSGSNIIDQKGVYGTQGTAAAGNIPGARSGAISWIDGSGNKWLFGGSGYDSFGAFGYLNDLWKFDGTNWTWVSGSSTRDQRGVYGTQGTAAAGNIPGGRQQGAGSWIDGSGNLWLFGGEGFDSAGTAGDLNDLWKFDGTNWTWVSGSNIAKQKGVYGTQGTAATGNIPGARYLAVSWIDGSGNRWLFGGFGYDSAGTYSFLNDLWKFDGTYWTWVSGSNIANHSGVYGTQGTAAAGNIPGARYFAVSWIDGSGNRWLFGGWGYDSAGTFGYLNDLWRDQP